MAALIYSAITSLDGYTNDEDGNFDWGMPDEEVHRFVNDFERSVGVNLYGRRMYEVMRFWDTPEAITDQPPVVQDYAQVWRTSEKVVYSSTLDAVDTVRTRLEPVFDPTEVRRMKESASTDLSIGGATIGATALRAGLVDEIAQFLAPIALGGGTPFLPLGLSLPLELLDERRFANGFVYLRYRVL